MKMITSIVCLIISVFTLPSFAQCYDTSLYRAVLPLADNINPHVLELAINAYYTARKTGLDHKGILTIVDYSLPSSQKRMWVLNLNSLQLIHYSFVTHGSGSGLLYARKFSNIPGSFKSSLGLFLTKKPYDGQVGHALRLQGLEPGFNDNAEPRGIVVHAAEYADENFISQYGRLGRSEGCFALPVSTSNSIIESIEDGTLLFAYYPDEHWLSQSRYL
ncbi:MAG: murein L,D-transpeptidase catalytic domain family protein [Gammaproteobacteria bacterium]|nr:murein L,D-transpeptidase catalytic domain family protein [Gammaproteobacteria bacterium]